MWHGHVHAGHAMHCTMPTLASLQSSLADHVFLLPLAPLATPVHALVEEEPGSAGNATCPDAPRHARARVDTLWTRQCITCPRLLWPSLALPSRPQLRHDATYPPDTLPCPRERCRRRHHRRSSATVPHGIDIARAIPTTPVLAITLHRTAMMPGSSSPPHIAPSSSQTSPPCSTSPCASDSLALYK